MNLNNRYIILGTAGHIDHGKSALVNALSGIDPDRLKEEKERGMTIELGFAELVYHDGLIVGIVDVPGHERLIRNMLAGSGGIDIVLFVIAADEGVMPQSREHLHICNLLKIKSGIVVITKIDLVDDEWHELIVDDVKKFVKNTFLQDAAIIPVSSKTFFNIDLLKEKIREVALKVETKSTGGLFRLPIDRVFTLKGFGTVVTGTAFSGSISIGDAVEILPCNIKSKVRGLHSHGISIKTAYAGQRVAMNLQGVDKEELKRGNCVVVPERFIPTKMIDAKLKMLTNVPSLKNRDIVHLHIGTSEVMARVILYGRNEIKEGERCYCQFRLMEPVITMAKDRYIIRRFSPMETIGGGKILDSTSYKMSHKKAIEDLKILESGDLSEKLSVKIRRGGIKGCRSYLLEGWINQDVNDIRNSIVFLKAKNTVLQIEDILFHQSYYNFLKETILNVIKDYHMKNPLKFGIHKEELKNKINIDSKIFDCIIKAIDNIIIENEIIRLKEFKITLSRENENLKETIYETIEKSDLKPPTREELSQILNIDLKILTDLLKIMVKEEKLVRITDSIYITSFAKRKMLEDIRKFFLENSEMRLSEFKKVTGATKKYAVQFVEYLDANKITMRIGEVRRFLLQQ
jgi:selenocysteine-specific elongation factor